MKAFAPSRRRPAVHLAPSTGRGRIASAIRVRDFADTQSIGNHIDDAFEIFQHLVVPEPQNTIALFSKPAIAPGITLAAGMLPAIYLDNETALSAHKIDRVAADRDLPDKFEPGQSPCAKDLPQPLFSLGRTAPKSPCTRRGFGVRPPHLTFTPLPAPCADLSPLAGRG